MTFLNPLVLFGLAAAAIPILIHLLNLRKLRTIEFSSLRFLKELQRSSIRRLRIRQWILLAVRTLLIAALVLAFSRPALKGSFASLIGGRAATTMVVLMDDSPSMTVRSQEGVLFNQARGAATKLASLLKEGDQMFLLPLSEVRHKDQFTAYRTREAAAQGIGEITPSQERVPFREAFHAAWRILAASSNANEEVYLISDAQATQFGPDSSPADTAIPAGTNPEPRAPKGQGGEGASPSIGHPASDPSKSAEASEAGKLDARTRLFLVRTAPGSLQNAGVASAEVTTRIITRGRPAELQAVIRNTGPAPAAGAVAGVYLDGARVMQQTVDLPAGGSGRMIGKFVPRRSGVLAGWVQIEDDAMEADNRRFFTLTVPERVNVLLVGTAAADTRYVNLGLTLQGDSTLAGLFAVKTIGDADLPSVDLGAVDVIVLCNLRGFSSAEAEQLARFVKSGGGLMIFPGSQANIPNYNETLFAKLGLPPAGPVAGAPAAGAGDGARGARFSFAKVDMAHPLFSGMFEQQAGKRAEAVASPHISAALTPGVGQQGHAVITLSNGAGFLVEYPSGSGRVLLFGVEAGVTWSDFPMQGLFAPLLYRSVLYVAARDQNARSFVVGEPIELVARLRGAVSPEPFVLTSPSGVGERVVPDHRGTSALAVFRSPRAMEAGVYELHRGGPQGATPQGVSSQGQGTQRVSRREPALAAVAVNVDSAESDLRPADDGRIQRFWASLGSTPGQAAVFAASQDLDASVEHSRYGVELWKHFLALALALALAEMVIGRASAAPAPEER